jgi:methionyl-tRNA formyltransferase
LTPRDIPAAPWRVGIISQLPTAANAYVGLLRSLGHEPVVQISTRRFNPKEPPPPETHPFLTRLLVESPHELDHVFPATKKSLAQIIRGYELDLLVCTAFPWRIPADAIAAAPLGILNGHPSKLPNYRGPTPFSWQIRMGEPEIGLTYHLMDPEFDTGAILAQGTVPFTDEDTQSGLWEKLGMLAAELLPVALARIAAGDPGDPQEGGSYQSLFEEDYVLVDPAATAFEVHCQVRAWEFTPFARTSERGPILEREGSRIRILKSSLSETEGAERLDCADGPLWILESEPA